MQQNESQFNNDKNVHYCRKEIISGGRGGGGMTKEIFRVA